jgi:hypothetical protein
MLKLFSIPITLLGCVQVNHISDKPGYYSCDCLAPSDPCLLDGECVREDKCPSKDNQAIVSTNGSVNIYIMFYRHFGIFKLKP